MMDYPKELIPNSNMMFPFPLQSLVERKGDYVVCYRLKGTVDDNMDEDTLGGMEVLKEECFEHIVHMSMNLIGGGFRPDHVIFVQKKPGSDPWNGAEDVCLEDFAHCIEEMAEATPVFYLASKVNNMERTVKATFNNSDAYKAFKNAMVNAKPDCWPEFYKGISVDVPFAICIEHAPSKLNYWHVQMEVYPKLTGEQLNSEGGVWRERIFNQIRTAVLCIRFSRKPELKYDIPESLYLKNID